MGRSLLVYADGGSRGNPGVAGYGAVVLDAATGDVLAERAEPLGLASNNVAEYSGLIAGLQAAARVDPGADVEARMDSKLVVEQMMGRWKIKHEDMRRLALEAREAAQSIVAAGGSVTYAWVPREKNAIADRLSNVGMDGESVERDLWREDDPAPQEPAPADLQVTARVVLVRDVGEDPTAAQLHRVADAVTALVGGAQARVVASADPGSAAVGAAIADRVGVSIETDESLDARRSGEGFGERVGRVSTAYHRVVDEGGLAVVIVDRDALRCVLAHLLGLTEETSGRLAAAPGSLHGIEVWADGTTSIAFTNRT